MLPIEGEPEPLGDVKSKRWKCAKDLERRLDHMNSNATATVRDTGKKATV